MYRRRSRILNTGAPRKYFRRPAFDPGGSNMEEWDGQRSRASGNISLTGMIAGGQRLTDFLVAGISP